jgi:hypothetical protein
VHRKKEKAVKTPIRAALHIDSFLQECIKDGLGAVIRGHKGHFDGAVRSSFVDSLDIDEALKVGHEQENRWDYLLGHGETKQLIGIEPHSAENSEISTVIRKRRAALDQLQGHLREGVSVASWLRVASGRVQFSPLEKATLKLAENGIQFVGSKITNRHIPGAIKR